MEEKILVLDFGGQYNQLIARRVREQHVYAEIKPYNKITPEAIVAEGYQGIIFTGGPNSVYDEKSPHYDPRILELGAGEGKTAAYLRTLGFEVRAVDLKPSGPGVEQGDIRRLDFAGESFDCCLAECTVSGCGDGNAALKEAFRVLKKNGCLLIADVFFKKKMVEFTFLYSVL